MCLLCCGTFILASSLLWWPRWSVNRIYRSSTKRVRSNTASVTVTESKCWRKGVGVRTCLAGRHWTASGAALPHHWRPFGRFVPQLQRALPVKAVAASWHTIRISQSWYLLVFQKLVPKFSDHFLKNKNKPKNKTKTKPGRICWKRYCRYRNRTFGKSLSVSQDQISDSNGPIINNCTCFYSQKIQRYSVSWELYIKCYGNTLVFCSCQQWKWVH